MDIENNKYYAIKTIWKTTYTQLVPQGYGHILLRNEIEISTNLDHENIIKCYKVYEDITSIHLVLELIEGGDLFDYICTGNKKFLGELKAIELFIQILESLHYIQGLDIVHRDIKPENFLVFNEGSKLFVKLIDFGFSTKIQYAGEKLKIQVGSLPYMAPEVIKGEGYDFKADMFAAGVILYNLVTGKQPFYGKDDQAIRNSIINSTPKFPEHLLNKTVLINFLESLLEKDPQKRISVQDAKIHPWIQEFIELHQQPTVRKIFMPNILNSISLSELVKFTNVKNNVRTNLLTYLELETAYEIKKYLHKNFDNINNQDIKGKFSINYEDFLEGIIKICENNENIVTKLTDILNTNRNICKDHNIDFEDNIDFFIKSRNVILKEKLWNFFKNKKLLELIEEVEVVEVMNYLKINLINVKINFLIYKKIQENLLKSVIYENFLNENSKITFEQFEFLWDMYEKKILESVN